MRRRLRASPSCVPAPLRLADVFACPTEYREGVPRVLLEAGLAGVPIVTTRVPGCDDVVTENWNGHLVPQRDPRALAAAVLDLLGDPDRARAMGSRSIEFVRREFDLSVVTARYVDLYRQLLSSGKSRDKLIGPAHDDPEPRAASLHGRNVS